MRIISLFLLIVIVACSSSETIIKPKDITIDVPAVTIQSDTLKEIESDSFDITFINNLEIPDSLKSYQADFTLPNSKEKATVKVYPKSKKAILSLPKQEIKTQILDTTKITIKKGTTFTEKVGYVSYGIALVVVLFVAGIIIYFMKFRK